MEWLGVMFFFGFFLFFFFFLWLYYILSYYVHLPAHTGYIHDTLLFDAVLYFYHTMSILVYNGYYLTGVCDLNGRAVS